jgi:hypothetical protein
MPTMGYRNDRTAHPAGSRGSEKGSRVKLNPKVEPFRIRGGEWGSFSGDLFGWFLLPGPCGRELRVLASCGDEELGVDWEHVSVSIPTRSPNWEEMCFVKSMFFDSEETVIQIHVPQSQWINNHPHCLHLWRPTKFEIALPPSNTIGNKELGILK